MHNFLRIHITWLVVTALLVYLPTIFIELSFNPLQWGEVTRIITAILAVGLYIKTHNVASK